MLLCKSNQLYEIPSYVNIGNIGISAITNIGVSAYRQKCHIGTPLLTMLDPPPVVNYISFRERSLFMGGGGVGAKPKNARTQNLPPIDYRALRFFPPPLIAGH